MRPHARCSSYVLDSPLHDPILGLMVAHPSPYSVGLHCRPSSLFRDAYPFLVYLRLVRFLPCCHRRPSFRPLLEWHRHLHAGSEFLSSHPPSPLSLGLAASPPLPLAVRLWVASKSSWPLAPTTLGLPDTPLPPRSQLTVNAHQHSHCQPSKQLPDSGVEGRGQSNGLYRCTSIALSART